MPWRWTSVSQNPHIISMSNCSSNFPRVPLWKVSAPWSGGTLSRGEWRLQSPSTVKSLGCKWVKVSHNYGGYTFVKWTPVSGNRRPCLTQVLKKPSVNNLCSWGGFKQATYILEALKPSNSVWIRNKNKFKIFLTRWSLANKARLVSLKAHWQWNGRGLLWKLAWYERATQAEC